MRPLPEILSIPLVSWANRKVIRCSKGDLVGEESGLLTKSGVGFEKLVPAKFAKIRLHQEALQSIFSGRLDIFYPPISAVWDEKRVFQHPQAIALIEGF